VSFYSKLRYSFGNEDWDTEHKALQIQPHDQVLCVTASGDRPLNLLTKELKEITAVDANPLQNALFDLKRVSLVKLTYPDYMAFLGVSPSQNRLQTYSQLQKDLDPMTSCLWELLPKKIDRGVLYEGSVEKLLKRVSAWFHFFQGRKIETLFAYDDLEQQQQFISTRWHTPLWKKAFQIALHPALARTLIRDPGLYEFVDPTIDAGAQLYERFQNYLKRNLAKESILLSLIFNGRVDPRYFPPYLTEEGVSKIKKQVDKASFHTDDLVSYTEKAKPESFDCFSISDVASYLSKEQFASLMEGIYRCAKPNARFCLRQLLSNHQIPTHLAPYFQRNTPLEQQLQQEDRCFLYSFMVGTIKKSH
jgi:S-adenosylmethionine-diacylglycerol 3-amino-3-carboxypropyl transferase